MNFVSALLFVQNLAVFLVDPESCINRTCWPSRSAVSLGSRLALCCGLGRKCLPELPRALDVVGVQVDRRG